MIVLRVTRCRATPTGRRLSGGRLLGLGGHAQQHAFALGLARGLDQQHLLLAFGHLGLARGEHALLLGHGAGTRLVGGGAGLALGLALPGDLDRALLLGELERLAPLDLLALDLALLGDALLLERAFGEDARDLDRLTRHDLRALGLLLALGALARQLGALLGARHLDVALLVQARVLGLAVDVQRPLFRLEVLAADRDHRVLLDVVALLLAALDLLGQARHAFGVEGVARVEELEAGLVELGQRGGLELEAVLRQVVGHRLAHAPHVGAALLVQLLHGHLGGRRAQRVDELALHQLFQALRLQRAQAEGLGGSRHRLRHRSHAHVELRDHVHAHAVLRDQRLVAPARDLQPQRVHVHRDHLVHDRQHEGAAVEHHLLSAEAGAHERALLARSQVQPVQQPDGDRQDDGDDDQAEQEGAELSAGHGASPVVSIS